VKILDMGLARFFHEDTAAFIKEYEVGYIIGTADYVAPEQIVDSRVDIRADIYSLGGTLYYLLVGKSPFQDGNNAQKMIWQQVRQPKSLRVLRPDVPEGLVRVAETMLAKEPARRYSSAEALAGDLNRWLNGEPILARSTGRLERLAKWMKRRPAVTALLGCGSTACRDRRSVGDVEMA